MAIGSPAEGLHDGAVSRRGPVTPHGLAGSCLGSSLPVCQTRARCGSPSPAEIVETLTFVLRHEGWKRVHHADDMTARIAVDRLIWHLELSVFAVIKRPLSADLTTSNMPALRDR